jgi:hypothetical protein
MIIVKKLYFQGTAVAEKSSLKRQIFCQYAQIKLENLFTPTKNNKFYLIG